MRLALISVVAAGTFLLAGAITYYELEPYFSGGTNQQSRYQAVVNGETEIGLSDFSHQVVLNGCLEAINSIYGRLQSLENRQAVTEHCHSQASTIVKKNPSNGYAWLIKAWMENLADDIDNMNASLETSRHVTPNEQWVAELRVTLSEEYRDRLTQANIAGNDQDLEMIVQTRRGAATIAGRYLSQQPFRARITAIVETLPEDVQRKFVNNVRSIARQRGLI